MRAGLWTALLLAFVGIAVVGDYFLTHWAIYENPSGNAGRLHHLITESGDEIPIFGSSKVYYDYVPSELGLNTFNYGLDGASFEVTDTLLEIELSKHKSTPIIIDLKPDAEHDIGDPSSYVPLAFDKRIRGLLERSGAMVWRFLVPGIRYFGYYDYYLKEWVDARAHVMRVVERGFSHEKYWSFDRARLEAAVARRIKGPNGYFPDESQNRRLIEHIRQHPERTFFLVYSPVHPSCLVGFRNAGEFDAFKAQLSALPNAVVLDYLGASYPDQWFKDTNHLLYDGAVAFSRTLGLRIGQELRDRTALLPAPAAAIAAERADPARSPESTRLHRFQASSRNDPPHRSRTFQQNDMHGR